MTQFDPYSEWLGLSLKSKSSASKPTYYQLLEVSPSEGDARLILENAKRQLAKLKAIKDPSKQQLKDDLMARVRRAAKCLVTAELRSKYDARLAGSSQGVGVTPPVAKLEEPVPASSVAIDPKAKKKSTVASRYKQGRQQSGMLWLSGILGLICLSGVAFLVATQTSFGRQLVGLDEELVASEPARPAPSKEERPVESSDLGDPEPEIEEPVVTTHTSGNETVTPSSTPPKKPTMPSPETPVEPRVTAAELKQLGDLLKQARRAIGHRETASAKQLLAKGKTMAKREQDIAKVARLWLLADYVESYWKALDETWAKLKGGEEIELLGQQIMIVEKSKDAITYRSRGRNKTLRRDSLPMQLQMAFADSWFDETAASTKVFRGAMMAVTPEYGVEQAREMWRDARQGGAELNDLELVLDDEYDLQP